MLVKDTDSFTYVLSGTCFPTNNIENIPRGFALRLVRICDSNERFGKHSVEYQNHLIARVYKPDKVKKKIFFETLKNLLRKRQGNLNYLRPLFSTSCNLITQHNLKT